MSLSGKDVPQSSDVRHKKKQPRYNNVYTFQAPAEILTRCCLFPSFSFFSLVLVIE